MDSLFLWTIFLFVEATVFDHTSANGLLNRSNLLIDLMADYDKRIPPYYHNGSTVNVDVGVHIIDLYNIDNRNMEFSVSIYFRRSWIDPRLVFTHDGIDKVTLDPSMMKHLWRPNIYFPNERKGQHHEITMPNTYLTLSKDGRVFLASKYSLTLSCRMAFQKFPMDTQHCKLDAVVYSYSAEIVNLRWQKKEPLELAEDLVLTDFELIMTSTVDCSLHLVSGSWSCLRATFGMKRNFGFYIITIYVPSTFIVLVSWVAFWVDPAAIPGRVTLGVTTVLTIVTQSLLAASSMPNVPYVKAFDVWMAICMLFVFMSLIEFAIVNVANQHVALNQASNAQKPTSEKNGDSSPEYTSENCLSRWTAQEIDKCARVAFPGLFICCNMAYWTFYLTWENDQESVM